MWLSVQVALGAMLLIVPLGMLVSWWLVFGRPFRGRAVVEALFMLPLVLPPTVVGFVLLVGLGRGSAFGRWLNDSVGLELLFTWQAAVVAAAVMAFPLFVRSLMASFRSIDRDLPALARTLGASELRILFSVLIPLAYRGLAAGFVLALARAIGEFGATLMVAGSIPGRTRTLSLALYSSVETGKDQQAWSYALLLLLLTLAMVATIGALETRTAARRG